MLVPSISMVKILYEYNKQQLKEYRQEKIAMVFQHFGLFNHRTILSNVEYGLEVQGLPKEEAS